MVFKIETVIIYCLVIAIGVIFILAGIFNWKGILLLNMFADVMIEMLGEKGYRILYIIIGVLLIFWMVSH